MMLLSWNFIDGFAGAVVSLLVLYSGIEAVKDTASPLIGEANNKELVQAIKDTVEENPNVLGIHDVLCHSYGSEKKYVSLHIEIAESMSLHDAHEIADELEEILEEKLRANVVIHVDPINHNDPVVSSLKEKAEKAIKELDPSVSIHDLHLHKEKKRIDCDIMAPYESKLGEEELVSAIKKALPEYDVRIHLDHPMDN
jgi:divalent metal cation (Fe/Co/Zn/Cd) transporter